MKKIRPCPFCGAPIADGKIPCAQCAGPYEPPSVKVQILLWGIIVVGLLACGFLNLTTELDGPRGWKPVSRYRL